MERIVSKSVNVKTVANVRTLMEFAIVCQDGRETIVRTLAQIQLGATIVNTSANVLTMHAAESLTGCVSANRVSWGKSARKCAPKDITVPTAWKFAVATRSRTQFVIHLLVAFARLDGRGPTATFPYLESSRRKMVSESLCFS